MNLTHTSTSNMEVDVESLLNKLVAAGIINTKLNEETLSSEMSEKIETATSNDAVIEKEKIDLKDEVQPIELVPENLRV